MGKGSHPMETNPIHNPTRRTSTINIWTVHQGKVRHYRVILAFSLFSQKESDLGIGAAMGETLAGPSSFWFFLQGSASSKACRSTLQRSYPSPNDPASSSSAHHQSWSNPTTPTRSSPVPIEKGIIRYQNNIRANPTLLS